MDEERKHPATSNRLAQAANDGECFHSSQLAVVLFTLLASGILIAGIQWVGQGIAHWTMDYWRAPLLDPAARATADGDLGGLAQRVGAPLGIGLLIAWCCAVLVYLWQIGWMWGRKPVVSWSSLAPAARWSQMFNLRRLGSNILGWFQALVAVVILAGVVWWRWDVALMLWGRSPSDWGKQLWPIAQVWLGPVLLAMAALALIDYWWQRTMFRRSLRMTDQELRDELRHESSPAR